MIVLAALVLVAQNFFGTLPIDGIHCDTSEGVVEHIHARLQIFEKGHPVAVPQGIGISNTAGCLYWLHTHTPDGYIHIESPIRRPFTLGEFFDIWGAPLSWTRAAAARAPRGAHLAVWVDGKRWSGKNPRDIVLHDHESIVIQSGPPFGKPLPSNWQTL